MGVLLPRRLCELDRCSSFSCNLDKPPPRIADTEDCAQRACFRMADVIVIHSVVIRAIGSIAMMGDVWTISAGLGLNGGISEEADWGIATFGYEGVLLSVPSLGLPATAMANKEGFRTRG